MEESTFIPKEVRTYIYGIALAVAILLGGYGLIAEEMLPLWITVVGAILGHGTATVYRPTRPGADPNGN